jgi:hypothetical protein
MSSQTRSQRGVILGKGTVENRPDLGSFFATGAACVKALALPQQGPERQLLQERIRQLKYIPPEDPLIAIGPRRTGHSS